MPELQRRYAHLKEGFLSDFEGPNRNGSLDVDACKGTVDVSMSCAEGNGQVQHE
jgi:hypothetical protein